MNPKSENLIQPLAPETVDEFPEASQRVPLSPNEIESVLDMILSGFCPIGERKKAGMAATLSKARGEDSMEFPRLTSLSQEELEEVLAVMAGEFWRP